MKQIVMLLLLFSLAALALSAETVTLSGSATSVSLISSSETETTLQYRISSFEKVPVSINGAQWYHVYLPKEGFSQEKGLPQLPNLNRSIIIANQAFMKLQTYDLEYQEIPLQVAPSKGIITRDINPDTVPYEFDQAYQRDAFYPETVATLSQPYILRDFRGITVQTTPFAYNPKTGILRVCTAFKVRIYAAGQDFINVLAQPRSSITRDFSEIYSNHFLNWDSVRYAPVDDSFGKLLVICHPNYMSTILPYVNWKIQKGIPTELINFSTVGTTATQLKTYIQNRYNADNSISYIQLVGDAPQIPSLSSGGGGSDPSFSLVAGSDNYPDIFIGRFSAETAAQVTAQINKAITYERDRNTTDTWLSRAMGISDQSSTPGDNGETDIQHMNNIRNLLLNYGYSSVDQIYEPNATAAQVTTNINAGRSYVNYVGHGSNTSWGTTGFSNTHATALTNGTKTPFIMDVACLNGNFVATTCFAEAWQRNANGGSVAIYASSINQSWDSPMEAQDEATALLVAEAKTTLGGLFYNASCSMMDAYGSDGVNMFKTWHIFGDASLLVRTKTPIAMNVTHPASIVPGTTSIAVATGVSGALVAITYNNTIYGRAYANSSGNATLSLSNPPTGTLNYTITVTAFNRVTYVGTIAQTVANPYPENPRFVAEWEPALGSIIAYSGGFGLPYRMIAALSNRGQLYVVVTSSTQSTASSLLSSNSVNMSNVHFVVRNGVNSYWTRDYGPWTIMDSDHQMGIVDFRYNRNRPYDDALNEYLDDYFSLDYYYLPLVATGGNVMTDGWGKMMSTNLILTENDGIQNSQVTEYSYTQSQLEDLVQDYLGTTEYLFFSDPLANSSIDHIDCHAKLLDVDKVMIARVPIGHSNYPAIEAVVDAWEAKTSSYGTPYQIFRVDQTSNNEPYANSFIFNNQIYVPQVNSTPSAADLAAIAAYQNAMPGFIVQGYYSSSFLSDDAVHCRVNTIFDAEMIHLRHQPLSSAPADSSIIITVDISHYHPLQNASSYVAFRHGSSGQWQYASLSLSSGDTWTATIPTPEYGARLYYYLLATDITGRHTQLPLCGASDPFELEADILTWLAVPQIAITETAANQVCISWNAVPNASSYELWYSNEPQGSFSLLGRTSELFWNDNSSSGIRKFYRVIASDEVLTK